MTLNQQQHNHQEWKTEIIGNPPIKMVHAPGYHSMFDFATGEVHRWGETVQDLAGRSPAPGKQTITVNALLVKFNKNTHENYLSLSIPFYF